MWIKTNNGSYIKAESVSAVFFTNSYNQMKRANEPNIVNVVVGGQALEIGRFGTDVAAARYANEIIEKIERLGVIEKMEALKNGKN